MKPLIRLAPQCIRSASYYPRSNICIRYRLQYQLVRSFATLPSASNKPQETSHIPVTAEPSQTVQSNVPHQNDHSTSQSLSSSPKTYESTPPPSEEHTYSPMTSQDWHELEANIDPVRPREWLDSDSPVPLNKDWPISQVEFNILPPEEQSRLANEDYRRKKLDFLRQEKLQDHNHLHPLGEPFIMPMVAPHRGYAPEGTTPPPIQKIPWQLRRPWNWIRTGAIALFVGTLLAAVAAWVIQHRDEWELRNLEKKAPAPKDWTEKARGYYAVALHHKNAGEVQLAVWALQRALVEAGYRWVIEPANVPEGERMHLDLANAWVIRTLVMWEIELEHWDKAISLMEGLSTAYEDENPLNHARRSDLLRILALPTEKTKGVQSANSIFQTAIAYAGYELPKNPKDPIILPEEMQGNALLLRVLEEYIIFQIRHGLKSAKQALPTLLSIANVYRQTPHTIRDVCAEGLVMLHIGEIMYALGHQDESIQWTERAVQSTRKARKNQSTDEDKQRCTECVGNGSNSLGILYEERGDFERALEAFKMSIDIAIESKNQQDVTRAANHFNRVANTIRENEEKLALLERRGMRLSR